MIKIMKILFLSQIFRKMEWFWLGAVATVSIIFFGESHENVESPSKILKIAKRMIKITKILFFKSEFPKNRVVLFWNSCYSQYYIFRGRPYGRPYGTPWPIGQVMSRSPMILFGRVNP